MSDLIPSMMVCPRCHFIGLSVIVDPRVTKLAAYNPMHLCPRCIGNGNEKEMNPELENANWIEMLSIEEQEGKEIVNTMSKDDMQKYEIQFQKDLEKVNIFGKRMRLISILFLITFVFASLWFLTK